VSEHIVELFQSKTFPDSVATTIKCVIVQSCLLMMEAVRTSETSVDNHSTRQYNLEDSSEHHTRRRENLKSHKIVIVVTLSCAVTSNTMTTTIALDVIVYIVICYFFGCPAHDNARDVEWEHFRNVSVLQRVHASNRIVRGLIGNCTF
jgi:uncharacterized membrane protein